MNDGQNGMITLGLQRISRLINGIELPWRAIHVAGTNGKGSVCAYLSGMLYRAEIRTGRFISPHIIDRWDCISINERPISESLFREVENQVKTRNQRDDIGASSFEILTATAFEVFNRERVRVGIVECGMGGRLDATNVLEKPLVTIISRIGKDHKAFLGDTIEKIAFEKAGIIKAGSPLVVECENDASALQEIQRVARTLGVDPIFTPSAESDYILLELLKQPAESRSLTLSQIRDMWLAYTALKLVLPKLGENRISADQLASVMLHTSLPGRNQLLSLQGINPQRTELVLLDGAHNAQALEQLSKHLREADKLQGSRRRTWLIACSQNKQGVFSQAIPVSDNIVITEFKRVDGMPWVKATPVQDVIPERRDSERGPVTIREPDLQKALQSACMVAEDGPMVITGSLYLASDVLRLLRDIDPRSAWARSLLEPGQNIRLA